MKDYNSQIDKLFCLFDCTIVAIWLNHRLGYLVLSDQR